MRILRKVGALGLTALLLLTAGLGQLAEAKVSAEEAAKLGNELTPVGAIRAGNAEGTIPAWEGGITEWPEGYEVGMHYPDPFADDEILFTITAENTDGYADHLSPGQVAMFTRYPGTWHMKVYPTRRSASYPQFVYDALVANATTATLTNEGNGVTGAAVAQPFPIPQNGLEAIWNHRLRYLAPSISHTPGQVSPTPGGAYTMIRLEEAIFLPYHRPEGTTDNIDNIFSYFLQTVTAPPRLAGYILLVHDTVDQVKGPRKAWTYNPGQRRVRRAPNVGYDNPGTASDGQRTNDQYDMYCGAPDRYDWELIGRREMYVPYNSYAVLSDRLSYDEIIHAGHLNPEHLRYELHRVWVVEATVKEGTSHIYARRTFYLDEDSWYVVVADQYDGRGQIWRVSEAYTANTYDVPTLGAFALAHYDLQNGRYLAFGLYNEVDVPRYDVELGPEDFTPAVLRQMGRR